MRVGLVFLFAMLPLTAEDIRCPDRISTTQSLAGAIAGWTAEDGATPTILASVTFFDGPPKQLASLVPDESHSQSATWQLVSNHGQYWLACGYSGTRITLARALPAGTKTCTVTYDPKQTVDGLASIERITCK